MTDPDERWAKVGAAIQKRMTQRQLTLAEMIRRTKISDKTLTGYIAGKPIVRKDKRWALCKGLMWTPDSIDLILDGKPPRDTLQPSTLMELAAERNRAAGVSAELGMDPADIPKQIGDIINELLDIRYAIRQLAEAVGLQPLVDSMNAWPPFKSFSFFKPMTDEEYAARVAEV